MDMEDDGTFKELWEVLFKAVNYLLVAHAAGMVTCLTLLKDYSTTPHLKGIGLLIAMFGSGFLLAVLACVDLTFRRGYQLSNAFKLKYDMPVKGLKWIEHTRMLAFISCMSSVILLFVAVSFIIQRLAKL